MKVLILTNSLATGGAEKLILDSIPLFIEQGIDVELALLNGTQHPFLKKLKDTSDCTVHSLSKKSVYNPLLIFKLIPFLRQFSVVHVHLFPSLYWAAIAKVLSGSKTKLVFTEHNTTNRRKGSLFKMLDRWIYQRYSKIIAITEEVANELKKRVSNIDSKIEVIYNGVDLKKIDHAKPATKSELSISEIKNILIQVSSFTPQKDQESLIKAMKDLPSNVHLLLVGDGPTKSECVELAKRLNIENRIQFLGLRMDVPNLLKMADVVVLSSHFEGLSLSSIEGMYSGKPFIASRVPGLINLVEGAGVLVPQSDSKSLTEEIKTLLNDEDYAIKIANQCIQRAKAYSIDRMVNRYAELYKQLWESQN